GTLVVSRRRPHLPSMRRILHPVVLLIAALHLYIGLRLLQPFGTAGQVAGAAALAICFWFIPKGWEARRDGHSWSILVRWITMGFFSWLLVLTVLRDVGLAAAAMLLAPEAFGAWVHDSAIAVIVLVPLITAVGYLMARSTARIVD